MAFLLIPVSVAILVIGLALALRDRPENPGASETKDKDALLTALNKGEMTPEEVVDALTVMTERSRARDFWKAHVYELWILGGLLLAIGGAMVGSQLLLGGALLSSLLVLLPVFIVPKGCEGRAALCAMFVCLVTIVLVVYTLFAAKWKGISWEASIVILGFAIAFVASLLRGQAHYANRE